MYQFTKYILNRKFSKKQTITNIMIVIRAHRFVAYKLLAIFLKLLF